VRIASVCQNTLFNYIEVLKPRETSLLFVIGACSAIIASSWHLPVTTFSLTLVAVALGSAGCNGLTNYLDRGVDARATRTRNRVLPSKRIYPAQKVLPLVFSLIIVALALAYYLNPVCFVFGLIGTVASAMWRKTAVSCTFLGIIASCSPVLIGWFAFRTDFSMQILLICLMIAFWVPIHIWSIMVAHREDYLKAGLNYFPLNLPVKDTVKVIFSLSLFLYIVSISLYFLGYFKFIYMITSNILGILMIYTSARLLFIPESRIAWKLYKLSSFPYLGITFLAMCLDILPV
jgi:protoheme IX farnesyltransferase